MAPFNRRVEPPMPYLMLQTNLEIPPEETIPLLENLSAAVAKALGKPESYVMVALEDSTPMLFAGNDDPTAYLELKSLGLPEAMTPALSKTLCGLIEQQLEIDQDRIYIEFSSPADHLWGWNGETF
jgi:phenylpyruvate tautomerase